MKDPWYKPKTQAELWFVGGRIVSCPRDSIVIDYTIDYRVDAFATIACIFDVHGDSFVCIIYYFLL